MSDRDKSDMECVRWWGYIDRQGYGFIGDRRAHRMVYEECFGPIPEGYHVHHRCHNRACVNPAHLEALPAKQHTGMHVAEHFNMPPEKVLAIHALGFDPNVGGTEVALAFNTQRSTVHRIWVGRSWPEITGGPARPVAYCEECGELITTGRRDKKFCCAEHRRKFNDRLSNARQQERIRALRGW